MKGKFLSELKASLGTDTAEGHAGAPQFVCPGDLSLQNHEACKAEEGKISLFLHFVWTNLLSLCQDDLRRHRH
ncbi:hypothetical protein ATANTOWER_000982 [Ataeniobius toweri]|uniref:Uncharacterized protein n=1 Tax=Ataeniobius toweri TaxID=208326 RepID=A0ABU7A491_9TELE|nr:hypothetical protein [Ataeniobius toweri]